MYLTFSMFFRICSEPFLFQLMKVCCLASYFISDINVHPSTENVTEKWQWVNTDLSILSYILSLIDMKIFLKATISGFCPWRTSICSRQSDFSTSFQTQYVFRAVSIVCYLSACSSFWQYGVTSRKGLTHF